MKIKFVHEDSYLIINFDIKNEKLSIIEDKSNDLLRNIFENRDFQGVKSWIINRCGGKKTIEEALELIKSNSGVSMVDKIKIKIS